MNLDFNNQKPIYLQIADMIREAIVCGNIKEGDAIPSVRQMAVTYSINPQTILKATQILIHEDILEKRRGQGMFVLNGAVKSLKKSETKSFTQNEIPSFIQRAKLLGFTKMELASVIKQLYEDKYE
ncbi:GntR family transcriptional regulator [Caldithrix abyssi]|nr:GntR family transcriptional regulator [Caldithrix abyssi]